MRAVGAEPGQPKIVLFLVVDQLRGDLPFRYRDRFGPDGFRYLMEKGVWYGAAHHPHANTETVVGHSTLSTGAVPARHGMIGNSWLDPQTGAVVKCFIDGKSTQVGGTSTSPAASPTQLLTTTVGDELKLATAGRSRAFAVSVKDRAAVALAGRGGKAFWFSTSSGGFVTSSYYYNALPQWASDWNARGIAVADYTGKQWTPLQAPEVYLFKDIPPFGHDIANYGSKFPHPYGSAANPKDQFFVKLIVSPAGDELTLKFAEELLVKERLGQNGVTDYLGISFSSLDLVSHLFTPNSPENEDILLRLDLVLANLFKTIERTVGLKNVLIVLSGDHGGPDVPEYLQLMGVQLPTATPASKPGRVGADTVQTAVNAALESTFQVSNLAQPFSPPYFYLNHAAVNARQLDPEKIKRVIATAARSVPGIEHAIVCDSPPSVAVDEDIFNRVRRNQNPSRSGDVYVIQLPNWQLDAPPADGEPDSIVNHGTPYPYDTYVPLVFLGMHLRPALVERPVFTTDAAATLSAFLKIEAPSGCIGVPLREVFGTP